jgi:hypothetical protein
MVVECGYVFVETCREEARLGAEVLINASTFSKHCSATLASEANKETAIAMYEEE